MLRRRWPLIAILAVVAGMLGLGATKILPKKFTSETIVLVEQPTVPGDYVKPVVNADTNQRLATMQQQILSRTRLEPVIRNLGLYTNEINQVPMDDLVERLRETIEVTPVQPMARTNADGLAGFTISVTFADANLAQQICSTVTSMFLDENLQGRQRQAEQTTGFLSNQLEAAKGKLDEQDARLAAFQRAHIGALPENQGTNLDVLGGLVTQLDAATQALNRAQQDRTYAESTLEQQLADWKATLNGHNPQTYAEKVTALETELLALRSKYTEDHPDVVRLKRDLEAARKLAAADIQSGATTGSASIPVIEPAQIQALRGQIQQFEQTIRERTAQQEDLHRRIRTYQARVESSPTIEQEYKALTRDYQSALEFYNTLLKQRDLAQMATDLEHQQQSEQFRILDPAKAPERPSFPDPLKFGLGGLAGGLALGIGLALLLEIRDTSVRSEKDIEVLLHLPVLAVVPTVKALSSKVKTNLALGSAARN
jgi:polysaccharide chain length determinant protein (PEP-CTERM system associated)